MPGGYRTCYCSNQKNNIFFFFYLSNNPKSDQNGDGESQRNLCNNTPEKYITVMSRVLKEIACTSFPLQLQNLHKV